ncbi:hypothetical protein FIU93_21370 [Labrenzia sp. THAF35]|uniref:hypothetical protein n=1 Tax=Labrenzia sp. THAF35 TaxID=2587854 RepID=UPI0012682EA7|nr:hypothetical protein [Labrenzia sp. THAF35]QFT69351.1 hypothetical protein FIU93_21370 [Labrenzia sp. THAF35]
MTYSWTTAAAHPPFVQFVIENISNDDVPDLSAWPYSAQTYKMLRGQILAALGEKKTPSAGLKLKG